MEHPSRLGARLLITLAALPLPALAGTGPDVLSASAGYNQESHDQFFDSDNFITTLGLSRQIDRWNYAGGLTYSHKDIDVPNSAVSATSKALGGYVSATGNLWRGGFVSLAASYGRNDTDYQPTLNIDADAIGYTVAVTQAIPLNTKVSAALTAAYTYSVYRPDNVSPPPFTATDSTQGLLSTGARLVYHASRYQPYVLVAYKHYRHDLIGNNDLDFFDVGVGASMPLGNGRRVTLALSNWLGLEDYQRLGATLTYTHPFK